MALLVGAQYLRSLKSSTTTTQTSKPVTWTREYAKAAKGKPKAKGGSDKPVVKKIRVSKADLRKRSVILTHAIPDIGEVGEELKVTRGFARNYLFPNHYAKLATEALRTQYAEQTAAIDFDARRHKADLMAQRKKIAGVTVLLKRQIIVETQKPMALVTKADVLEKLKKQHNMTLTPAQVELPAPLDRYGKFDLPVQLEGVSTTLKINIQQR